MTQGEGGITRRSMLGYLLAAPVLVAGARWVEEPAEAQIPSLGPTDIADLSDILTLAAAPTMGLLTVRMRSDGTAHFALPRSENGQGLPTTFAMIIADEMDMPLDKVHVSLADANPNLLFNQLTGGSNNVHALYTPVRTAAASARQRLAEVAASELRVLPGELTARDGVFTAPNGKTLTFASLAEKASVDRLIAVQPRLKPRAQLRLLGTDQKRTDGPEIVTGRKQFAMDLDIPEALPTMMCRAPTIGGGPVSVQNLDDVKKMPGVTDVAVIRPALDFTPGGVAVRAQTFGQCMAAVRALKVTWSKGRVDDKSDASVLADLKAAELPLTPALPGDTIEELFTFHFRPGDALETNSAVADVRKDRAVVWSAMKTPVFAQQRLAEVLGLPVKNVTLHITQGGGSFGRRLFADAAFEAAIISKSIGKPVKLMWHRTDSFRQGRVHPMATSRVRVTHSGDNVLAFDQRHTSVATDYTHGLGEIMTSMDSRFPGQNFLQWANAVFYFTADVPYQFGLVSQLLNEIYEYNTFNTSSVRNIYSPDVCTATELMVDRVAAAMGKDPMRFRHDFMKEERTRAVLDRAAQAGNWGRTMPAGTAQGIAVHREYKGVGACLVEIDCRPETVNRQIRHAYTGPRVTKAVFVADVGLPVNPLGLRAQMMGGTLDGIANALSYGLHLKDGYFLEGSWDDAFYTRQWNTPPELEVIVMPPTTGVPGGAGEFAVGPAMAATACAYARATGKMPTSFPINHDSPLGFEPFPTVPPIPESGTDGLARAGIVRKKAKPKRKPRRRKRAAGQPRPSTKA